MTGLLNAFGKFPLVARSLYNAGDSVRQAKQAQLMAMGPQGPMSDRSDTGMTPQEPNPHQSEGQQAIPRVQQQTQQMGNTPMELPGMGPTPMESVSNYVADSMGQPPPSLGTQPTMIDGEPTIQAGLQGVAEPYWDEQPVVYPTVQDLPAPEDYVHPVDRPYINVPAVPNAPIPGVDLTKYGSSDSTGSKGSAASYLEFANPGSIGVNLAPISGYNFSSRIPQTNYTMPHLGRRSFA